MKFIKAGEIADSNIFNKLDERKKSLLEGGMDVINLSIGTPDFQPGKHVMEAVSRAALDPDMYKYSLNETRELLDAVENWYKRRYDVTLADDEIMAVCGSQEGIAHVGFAFAGPNDLILAPDPGYPIFSFGPMMTGATVGLYPLYAEKNWQLDFNDIPEDVAERAKAIVVSYPNNPTGAIMNRDELQAIANVIRETNIMVLSDEIYNSLTYGPDRHVCFAEIDGMKERTIVVDGFSKSYAMTGWRLGWAMGPKELMRHICKIHQFGIMSAPTTAQFAGIEAIRTGDDDIARMRDQYDLRRRFLLGELRSMGLDCFEPEGAFYIFPSIESTGLSSEEFCERLLHEQEVAVIPGSAFGASGEGHVRISYSYSMNHLREACSRMRKFLENLKNEQK